FVSIPKVAGAGVNPLSPEHVVERARHLDVDLVVVGPEAALAAGVADALIEAGIPVFGPTAAAARIETSKVFCRDVCSASNVPTAEGRSFAEFEKVEAKAYVRSLESLGQHPVVKRDGLAAGK